MHYYEKPWFAEEKLYGSSYSAAKRKYMFAVLISLKVSIAWSGIVDLVIESELQLAHRFVNIQASLDYLMEFRDNFGLM